MNNEIINRLTDITRQENIICDADMAEYTSFRAGGKAAVLVQPGSAEELREILRLLNAEDVPHFVLGNGTNVLFKDSGYDGVVVRIGKAFEGVNIEGDVLRCGSGTLLSVVAREALAAGLTGFEFASGIPGTIGGAIKMNAGAYGSEFKDIVLETTCIDLDGKIMKLDNRQQKFEYRKSIFKNEKFIILESRLLLKYAKDITVIKEKMDEYKKARLEKQPIEFPSAGSTFKRGEDFITAKLIDECGLKGYSIGGAQVSTKHAGFVINTGDATAEDVLTLINFIKKSVFEKFGKNIELEVEILGE